MLIIGNRDVLMKIIVISKFIQLLRPTRRGYEIFYVEYAKLVVWILHMKVNQIRYNGIECHQIKETARQ